MYKVFFQDRIIFVTEDFKSHFFHDYGLFYKYYDQDELADLLKLFAIMTKIKKLYIFHKEAEQAWSGLKKCFTIIEAAGGLIFSDQDEILVIKRRGKWDFPKGKLEHGESHEQAALREVQEETGLNELSITRPLQSTYHIYDKEGDIILKNTAWFWMTVPTREQPSPETGEDITEAIWLDRKDLPLILGNTYLSIVDLLQSQKLLEF